MDGRIKGESLVRIWKTFRARGHDRLVETRLPQGLSKELESGYIAASEWYPIDLYLALYGALLELTSYDEVVATAHQSVSRGIEHGSWRVFVPVLAGLAPIAFAERSVRRFEMVYKVTFDPGDAQVAIVEGGADVQVNAVPWTPSLAWRAGVTGGLLAIATLARIQAVCHAHDAGGGDVRFELRWARP